MTDEPPDDWIRDGSNEPLRVGDVVATTFRTIGANPGATLGLTAALVVPTSLVGFALQIVQFYVVQPMFGAGVGALVVGIGSFALLILMMLALVVLMGTITQVTIETLLGRATTIHSASRASLARVLPLLGTMFVAGLLQLVGIFLCIAPGVIAWVWLAVAVPACVAEKIGPIAAVQRSIELTEGHRLSIFLVDLVLTGVLVPLLGCAITPGLVSQAQQFQESLERGVPLTEVQDPLAPLQLVSTVFSTILQVPWTAVFSVLPAVMYVRLRGLRESVDAKAVAQVFA